MTMIESGNPIGPSRQDELDDLVARLRAWVRDERLGSGTLLAKAADAIESLREQVATRDVCMQTLAKEADTWQSLRALDLRRWSSLGGSGMRHGLTSRRSTQCSTRLCLFRLNSKLNALRCGRCWQTSSHTGTPTREAGFGTHQPLACWPRYVSALTPHLGRGNEARNRVGGAACRWM